MAFNFPNSPSVNQQYPSPAIAGSPVWQWNGSAWITVGGQGLGATIYISDTPPAGALDNTLWWESDSGSLYVKYNDGDSSQWVVAAPTPDLSAFVAKAGDTMTGSLLPSPSGIPNLGSTSNRWGTVYTSDLSLKNDKGDWTIVEGEDDLFITNNKIGKKYKFALVEV